ANNSKNAILNAFKLIGQTQDNSENAPAIIPTAKTRKGLDFLEKNTPDTIKNQNIALKSLLQDIFNWNGENKVNKPLVRAFGEAIETPGKYPQTVELTAYLAAVAPLLEADHLADMYELVHEVDTAFAPAKYTMQLSNQLVEVFDK